MSAKFELIERKKDKVIVRQIGNPCFDYPVNTRTLSCPCSKHICEHVQYYLQCKGVSTYVVSYLKIPTIREHIRSDGITDGAVINQACLDFLYDDEQCCSICLASFLEPGQKLPRQPEELFHICKTCSNIFHQHCFLGWDKGCPVCRKGHPEPKKDSYGRVEDFPALL